MNKKSFLNIIAILLVIVFALVYSKYQKSQMIDRFQDQTEVELLKTLPNIELIDYKTNQKVMMADITKDYPVQVLHFWATWCGPCEAEFPELINLVEKMKSQKKVKFYVIAVNDKIPAIKKFFKRFNIDKENVHLLLDKTGEGMARFGTVRLPETFVFKNGELSKRLVGAQEWEKAYYVNMLERLVP